jgi:hypothetical protein
MMDEQVEGTSSKKLNWRAENKKVAKQKVLDSIPTLELDCLSNKVPPNILHEIPHFYHPNWNESCEQYFVSNEERNESFGDTHSDEENEFLGICAPSNPGVLIEQKDIFGQLQVVETLDGIKLMESEKVPIFILCPRYKTEDKVASAHADILHLEKILSKYSKAKGTSSKGVRGKKKTGFCERYATIGAHARRGGRGISVSNPDKIKCCAESLNHLKKMVKRMEHFGTMVLPFGLLSTLRTIRQSVNDTVSLTSLTDGEERIWASLATSYNYMSPAHVDDDAFLTALTVSYVPELKMHQRYYYCNNLHELPILHVTCVFLKLGLLLVCVRVTSFF